MDKITLPGACLWQFVGILPGFCTATGQFTQGFASFFGGTSLLIMVGRNPGFPPANRDPAADASVRWADEERKDTGTAIIVIGIEFGDIANY